MSTRFASGPLSSLTTVETMNRLRNTGVERDHAGALTEIAEAAQVRPGERYAAIFDAAAKLALSAYDAGVRDAFQDTGRCLHRITAEEGWFD